MSISTHRFVLSLLLATTFGLTSGTGVAADPPKPTAAPAAQKPATAKPSATPAVAKAATPAAKAVTKPVVKKPAAKKSVAKKPVAKKKSAFKYTADNTLIWRGDLATSRSIVDDIAELYEKSAKIHIEMQPFSTISGLDAVSKGNADLAGSARGADKSRVEESGLNFIPQALDAIVTVVHPRNPIVGLSLRQIRQIYLGRVRNWKEVGGLDAPINLYAVAAPMDGIEYSMRELLYGKGDQRIAAPRLYINTGSMEEGITLDPNALGLSTLSAVGRRGDLKMLSVAGIAPSVASVQSGRYPLYVTLFLVTRADNPKQVMIDAFLAFLATPQATKSMRDNQLVPISEVTDAIARDQSRVAFIKSELARDPVPVPGASPGVGVTPVSAPNATAIAKVAIAPAAESTLAAQQRAAKEKAAREADAKQAATNKAATDKAKTQGKTPVGKN